MLGLTKPSYELFDERVFRILSLVLYSSIYLKLFSFTLCSFSEFNNLPFLLVNDKKVLLRSLHNLFNPADNRYIFINETAQQIQKFRDNPTEDHIMINNFIGFSNLKHDNQKISDHSMITEINGYRTKKVLENYKANFFSPYMGNDVIEINSIISKYLASATFDAKNTRLIDLLFNRIHTIKAHSLTDDILKTSFRELESYFQDKNETLIGIIDYEFNIQQNR